MKLHRTSRWYLESSHTVHSRLTDDPPYLRQRIVAVVRIPSRVRLRSVNYYMFVNPFKEIIMSKKFIVIIVALIAVAAAWYAFRPERLFINREVNERFPDASAANMAPMKLASGEFHAGAHETKGTATIFKLADGKRTLRLSNFETSNGPDVHVYLVAAADTEDNETVKRAGFVELGSLYTYIGYQDFDVPSYMDH